ncbi:MAG: hypothetical protein A3J93_02160 [Candidatus Magasanikbacteria bacterium RIFOXYC2_FULL_42_28]|uniref:Uncharacterized protein n=1 Tax=Candidatus Magasanikbacteria bacterium RIFOXYC2_FULL_42_28 TaxID=1798704 RepID=A0A1F6NWP1_9BACT|nr:MAG: hypothetical protein A3J93_02160 [Candidatus Magasanikbacteria bacterium RIFOXYC2_FULL_42_28]
MWRWIKEELRFYAKLLNFMRRAIHDWKMYLTFWQSKVLKQRTKKIGNEIKFRLRFPIRFMSDFLNTTKNYTKENMSQLFQRRFLI